MRLALLVAVAQVPAAACTRPAGEARPTAPASAMAPAEPAATRSPGPEIRKTSSTSLPEPVVDRLASSVESIGTDGHGAAAAEQLASALRGLAGALELLPGASWQRVKGVFDAARELATDEPALDRRRVRLVRDGLGAAARVLVDVDPPPSRAAEFQAIVASLGAAIDALDPEGLLVRQHGTILRGFRAAADAILLAGGRERQFSVESSPLASGSPFDFAARVAAASSAVEKLAQSGMSGSRRAASDVLRALADAIEAAPDKSDRITGIVSEVRFEAERLRRSQLLSFDDSRWIQLGLAATLDALEALSSARTPAMKQWLASGRRATQAIAAGESFSFQRAAVQDAFRAVADAFTASAQRCGDERPAG